MTQNIYLESMSILIVT